MTIYFIDFDLHRQSSPRSSNVSVRMEIEAEIAGLLKEYHANKEVKFWSRNEHDETVYEIHFDDSKSDDIIEKVIANIHKSVLHKARLNNTGYKFDTRVKLVL